MSEIEKNGTQWRAPNWAQLLAWLTGLAVFANEAFIEPVPRFPLLILDTVVLMGVSPKVVGDLWGTMRGRSPEPPPPSTPREGET